MYAKRKTSEGPEDWYKRAQLSIMSIMPKFPKE